jgi:hypothetical protein
MSTWKYSQRRLSALQGERALLSREANDRLMGHPHRSSEEIAQAGDLMTQIQKLDAEIHECRMTLWRRDGRPNPPTHR